MAVTLTGTGGNVTWAADAAATQGVTSWVVEGSVELVDITSIDDTTWRNFTTGHRDWTATIDTLDAGGAPELSVSITAADLTLGDGVAGSNLVLSNAICTGVTINDSMGDVVRTTYTFVCGGAIT